MHPVQIFLCSREPNAAEKKEQNDTIDVLPGRGVEAYCLRAAKLFVRFSVAAKLFVPKSFAATKAMIVFVNKRINFHLHRFIHLDERRPGAFETCAGNFLCRGSFHFFTSGLRVLSLGNMEKSRSAVQSSRTPWCRHSAAIRASWMRGPDNFAASASSRSFSK